MRKWRHEGGRVSARRGGARRGGNETSTIRHLVSGALLGANCGRTQPVQLVSGQWGQTGGGTLFARARAEEEPQ